MKKFNLLFLFIMLTATVAFAQVDVNNPPGNGNFERPQRGLNLLRDLNLNQKQIQQIRQINRDSRPLRQAAAERFKKAKQTLDESIHADIYDEAKIQLNLRELLNAQGEMLKLKIESELAVRKILTPEQLTKFREIRNNFDEQKEQRQIRRKQNRTRPNQRRRKNP